jgi:SAM-dependent methyltransferase
VARHLNPGGRYLLDAGSGPIQYPEYLEYSRNYQYRVCADISITALQEARRRIGAHGQYVVADIAHLPFKSQAFEGVVSLHTIHHLPDDEHLTAYQELYRVLLPGWSAAVVNGWPSSKLMDALEPLVRLANRLRGLGRRVQGTKQRQENTNLAKQATKTGQQAEDSPSTSCNLAAPKGTFTNRHDFAWTKSQVGAYMPLEIFVWRSVSVRFLRAVIHPWLGGRYWLRLLYWLEERYPHYFGQYGQYPLIVIRKRKFSSAE